MKKLILRLVLIFFIFTSTTAVYSQVRDAKNDDMFINNIGDFYLVDQNLVSDSESKLIPVGAIQGVHDVYYVEYQYEVIVKEHMNLNVQIEDLSFTNSLISVDDLKDTFNFEVTQKQIQRLDYTEHMLQNSESAEKVQVSVRVSMNEPETKELFEQMVGGSLSFEVYFYALNE